MSFLPLPPALENRAARWAALPVCSLVDLGCGEGEVARWLRPHGLPVLGLDRSCLEAGPDLHVRGDAHHPPFRPVSLDGLLAANLYPHTLAQDPAARFLERWLGLLNPRGWLFLMGDQPADSGSMAEQNYQKLQAFLAEIMPGTRGPLVPGVQVARRLEQAGARNVAWGMEQNRHQLDTEMVLEMLAGVGPCPEDGPASRLSRCIRNYGISLGCYWWVEAQAPNLS